LEALGRPAAALEQEQAAVAMWRRLYGDGDHPHLAKGVTNMAHILLALGRVREALACAEQAAAMIERLVQRSHGIAASLQESLEELGHDALLVLQILAVRTGDPARAFAAAERSRGRDLLERLQQERFDPLAEVEHRAQQRDDTATAERAAALARELDAAHRTDDRLLHDLTLLYGNDQLAGPERGRRQEEIGAARRANTERLHELLDERARLCAEVLPLGSPRPLAEIQAALGSGELLLLFTLT